MYVSTGTNPNGKTTTDSNTAILLEQGQPQPVYVYYYEEVKAKPKKSACCCSIMCALCCAIFLILFFLIPRRPWTTYESTVVTFNPYRVVQKYNVKNRNMYSLKLSDLDLEITTNIEGQADLVGYGQFLTEGNSYTIPKNSEEDIEIVYIYNATAQQVAAANQQCFSSDGVKYKTTGTVSTKILCIVNAIILRTF